MSHCLSIFVPGPSITGLQLSSIAAFAAIEGYHALEVTTNGPDSSVPEKQFDFFEQDRFDRYMIADQEPKRQLQLDFPIRTWRFPIASKNNKQVFFAHYETTHQDYLKEQLRQAIAYLKDLVPQNTVQELFGEDTQEAIRLKNGYVLAPIQGMPFHEFIEVSEQLSKMQRKRLLGIKFSSKETGHEYNVPVKKIADLNAAEKYALALRYVINILLEMGEARHGGFICGCPINVTKSLDRFCEASGINFNFVSAITRGLLYPNEDIHEVFSTAVSEQYLAVDSFLHNVLLYMLNQLYHLAMAEKPLNTALVRRKKVV